MLKLIIVLVVITGRGEPQVYGPFNTLTECTQYHSKMVNRPMFESANCKALLK